MGLDDIALRMMTTGITMQQIEQAGWELRKGKTIEDVRKAQSKAKKNGMYKMEYELDFCELYLKDVLKKKRA